MNVTLSGRVAMLLAAAGLLLLSGCANTTAGHQFDGWHGKPKTLCILENPKVRIMMALPTIQKSLEKRGVQWSMVKTPDACRPGVPILRYTARRSWSNTTYLGDAMLMIFQDGTLVSRAKYQSGLLTVTKWGRTAERLDELVGEVLGEKSAQKPDFWALF